MSFGSTDYEWVDKIAHTLCSNPTISKRKNIDFWEIANNNHYFINWLLNNDCEPSKSLDLKFPSKIPEKYMVDFIRGVIDGDGSIRFKDKIKTVKERGSKHIRTYFCSSSISFITGIKHCLDKLGIKYTYEIEMAGKVSGFSDKSKKPAILKSDNYRVSLYHKEAFKLLKLVYYKDNRFSLSRKQKTANEIIYYYENVWADGKDENNPAAILTNDQVRKMRELWSSGKFNKKSHLIKYCKEVLNIVVNKTTYYQAINGDTFKNVK